MHNVYFRSCVRHIKRWSHCLYRGIQKPPLQGGGFSIIYSANILSDLLFFVSLSWAMIKIAQIQLQTLNASAHYFVDGHSTGTHSCNLAANRCGSINLQMEGSSGEPGPQEEMDYYIIKDVVMRRLEK